MLRTYAQRRLPVIAFNSFVWPHLTASPSLNCELRNKAEQQPHNKLVKESKKKK